MSGNLIGIARALEIGAPLEEIPSAAISVDAGVEGDARGRKPLRQVTVLFREGWEDACRDLGAEVPWVKRRANLYVANLDRPRTSGGRLRIGDVELEVTKETAPCHLMDRAHEGLRVALQPDWRGGVCCSVVNGGEVRLGDRVEYDPPP
ncbi:MAG TPA: MOSC domain-containing protein [Rhizomicrobium sp.]|jgi:MOSC domain-containing protein YiiM